MSQTLTEPPVSHTAHQNSRSIDGNKSTKSIDISGPIESLDLESPPDETSTAEGETHYPIGTKFWLIMLSIGLVLIIATMDASIVAVAVPSMTDHWHTVADVGWYSAAYRLCQCSFQFSKYFWTLQVIKEGGVLKQICVNSVRQTVQALQRQANLLNLRGHLLGWEYLVCHCTIERRLRGCPSSMRACLRGNHSWLLHFSKPYLAAAQASAILWSCQRCGGNLSHDFSHNWRHFRRETHVAMVFLDQPPLGCNHMDLHSCTSPGCSSYRANFLETETKGSGCKFHMGHNTLQNIC